jgi:tRNA-specific 2-thiouridylase
MLPHVLFPLGESVKSDVRKEAHSAGLPTAARRDSQGICFLGKLDMHDFLKHYIEEHEGNVLNEQGEVVGTHRGVQFYTLGERHGFTVTNTLLRTKPLYIVNKDVAHNTLTVRETHPHKEAGADFVLSDWNQFVLNLEKYEQCDAVFRYHGERTPVIVKRQDTHRVTITLQKGSMLPAQGQTCVLYSGSQVVGGGIIE